jgi:hypothetical protein
MLAAEGSCSTPIDALIPGQPLSHAAPSRDIRPSARSPTMTVRMRESLSRHPAEVHKGMLVRCEQRFHALVLIALRRARGASSPASSRRCALP